jgi:hypothetical protein
MDNKLLALIGAVLLVVGVFLPIANLPIVGSMNLIMPGGNMGDGIFVVVLAVIAAALALTGRVRHVIWPGALTLAFVVWKYLQVKGALDDATASMGGALGNSVQVNLLGWGVLLLGALLLVYAGIASRRTPARVDGAV